MLVAVFMALSAQSVEHMNIAQLFSLIEKNNAEIRQRQTGVEAAREGEKAARSEQLPDINASLSGSYVGNALLTDRNLSNAHGLHSPHLGNEFTLSAQQVVYAGGAISAGISLAQLGTEQAAWGLQLSRQNLRLLAVGQYLDLQKLANREQVLKSNIDLTQKLIDHIKVKHAQGVALQNDVTRYELQMQTLRLHLTQLHNQRRILNHQLCNTLGLPVTTTIEPTEDTSLTQFPQEEESDWQALAQGASPMLQMAAVDEKMAQQKVKLAKSDMLPKVAIVAANDFNGPITFELPPINKNLNIWYVGVGVKYALSSLFKSNRKLNQARLLSQETRQAHEVATQQVNNQVQAAHTDYLQSYVELETQRKNVELANQNFDVVRDRYENQLALITDMIDASNMKLDAELSEADARINIAYAYYKLKHACGTL